jgi:hypothetical protein
VSQVETRPAIAAFGVRPKAPRTLVLLRAVTIVVGLAVVGIALSRLALMEGDRVPRSAIEDTNGTSLYVIGPSALTDELAPSRSLLESAEWRNVRVILSRLPIEIDPTGLRVRIGRKIRILPLTPFLLIHADTEFEPHDVPLPVRLLDIFLIPAGRGRPELDAWFRKSVSEQQLKSSSLDLSRFWQGT